MHPYTQALLAAIPVCVVLSLVIERVAYRPLRGSFRLAPLISAIGMSFTLENLGFCKVGEGGPFVESTDIGPGGTLPTNTNGGGLSYTHPGMYGMFLVVEAVRQLRGECGERQIVGARTAIAHGNGGTLSSQSTAILGTHEVL